MQIAVIIEPTLRDADRRWIDAVRARHDPRHGWIAPHVTLVFPHTCDDPAAIIGHVERVAARHAATVARLRVALPVKDPLGAATHVHLVPDEGMSALVRLHDDLYREALAGALRLDVPYIPHVTVALAGEAATAKAIADGLNAGAFDITWPIDAVAVLRCDTPRPQVLKRIGLGGALEHACRPAPSSPSPVPEEGEGPDRGL